MDIDSSIQLQTQREAVPSAMPARVRVVIDEAEPGPLGFRLQTLGGVFDAAFELYKQNFTTIAFIVACVFIPTQVLLHAAGNLWMKPLMAHTNPDNPDFLSGFAIGCLGLLIGAPQYGVPGYLSLLTSFMASGPVAVAIANVLIGRPLSVAAAYQRAVPIFWRLIWTWTLFFLTYVLVLVLTLVVLVIVAGIAASTPGLQGLFAAGGAEVGIAIVIIMAIVPYVISCLVGTALFAFAPPLIALENLTVMGAVERNSRLVSKGVFWRTCLTISLLPILVFGLQYLMLLSASSVVEAFKWPSWAYFVVNTGLSSIVSFFFQPYWMVLITLMYFDCRVRREGLDVRFMTDNLASLDEYLDPSPPAADAAEQNAAPVVPPAGRAASGPIVIPPLPTAPQGDSS